MFELHHISGGWKRKHKDDSNFLQKGGAREIHGQYQKKDGYWVFFNYRFRFS
jgi:hypothetical protein